MILDSGQTSTSMETIRLSGTVNDVILMKSIEAAIDEGLFRLMKK